MRHSGNLKNTFVYDEIFLINVGVSNMAKKVFTIKKLMCFTFYRNDYPLVFNHKLFKFRFSNYIYKFKLY